MQHITKILPDLDKMPDWAREAFEAGQFFNVAFKRVEKLEKRIKSMEENAAIVNKEYDEMASNSFDAEMLIHAIKDLLK